jgi:hypothetical protein
MCTHSSSVQHACVPHSFAHWPQSVNAKPGDQALAARNFRMATVFYSSEGPLPRGDSLDAKLRASEAACPRSAQLHGSES